MGLRSQLTKVLTLKVKRVCEVIDLSVDEDEEPEMKKLRETMPGENDESSLSFWDPALDVRGFMDEHLSHPEDLESLYNFPSRFLCHYLTRQSLISTFLIHQIHQRFLATEATNRLLHLSKEIAKESVQCAKRHCDEMEMVIKHLSGEHSSKSILIVTLEANMENWKLRSAELASRYEVLDDELKR
jgi:hypothetical protein